MSTKYNEAMEHVQLTAEARERILKNVENAEGSSSVKNASGDKRKMQGALRLYVFAGR